MEYCLGTVQFGMNYGIQDNGKPNVNEVNDILTYAIDNKVVVFDTASAYGDAESVLGNYFRENSGVVGTVKVVSKLSPQAFENQEIANWEKIVLQNVKESINKIGCNKLYAYLFHNAACINDINAVKALHSVKRNGFADMVGVSIYTPDEAMKALEYEEIEAIQIPYNVFDQRLEKCDFFEKAKEKNICVFARSSLLQGLALMDPDKLPINVLFAKPYIEKFRDICQKYDVLPLSAAIGYVLSNQWINFLVFGTDNLIQLQEYLMIKEQNISDSLIMELKSAFCNVEERLINPVLWK